MGIDKLILSLCSPSRGDHALARARKKCVALPGTTALTLYYPTDSQGHSSSSHGTDLYISCCAETSWKVELSNWALAGWSDWWTWLAKCLWQLVVNAQSYLVVLPNIEFSSVMWGSCCYVFGERQTLVQQNTLNLDADIWFHHLSLPEFPQPQPSDHQILLKSTGS